MSPTAEHRARQLALRRVTISQLGRLWPMLDWAALDRTYPRFALATAALVERNRRTSAGLAAAYLRALRRQQGLPDYPPVLAKFNPDQFQTALRVTSVITAKKAASRGVPADEAMSAAQAVTAGAMARLVLNGGRETVNATGKADPQVSGWRWVLGGSGHCAFCLERDGQMFDDSAEFHSHDTCGCTPELAYR